MALIGDGQAGVQSFRRVTALKLCQWLQMTFAIALQLESEFADAAAMADGGEYVLQRLARGVVQVHVVCGHNSKVQAHRQCESKCRLVEIVLIKKQLQREIKLGQPFLQRPAFVDECADITQLYALVVAVVVRT